MSSTQLGKSSPPRGVETRAPKKLKTLQQVQEEFQRRGQSVSEWARLHGFNRQLVADILKGDPRRKCRIGKGHRIAVLLGLKHGEIV